MFQKKIKDNQENKNSSIPFFFGFISGIIAGVLFAPNNGSVTRKSLSKNIKSLVNNLQNSEIGQKITSNPKVIKTTEKVTNDIKDPVEKKATSIINSPIAKKIVTTTLADIKPVINRKTGKKFVSKKK